MISVTPDTIPGVTGWIIRNGDSLRDMQVAAGGSDGHFSEGVVIGYVHEAGSDDFDVTVDAAAIPDLIAVLQHIQTRVGAEREAA